MRWFIGFLVGLSVGILVTYGGGFEAQKKKTAGCDLEWLRLFPDDTKRPFGRGEYIEACMRAAGYESVYTAHPHCMTAGIGARDPYCYVPMNHVARLIYQTEMALQK